MKIIENKCRSKEKNGEKRIKKNYQKSVKKITKRIKKNIKNTVKIIKKKYIKKDNEQNARLCFDPKEKNICTYKALRNRKQRHKEKYKDVILKDCIIQPQPQS